MLKAKSFLVINTFGIGDVLFSTPLLRNLRENYPQARIYYLCNKKTEPLLRTNPLIFKTFVYERDDFVNLQKKSFWQGLLKYKDFIGGIRREKIDIALDLSLNTPFGFFAWAAGIKKRFGLDYKKRGFFLTKKISIDGFINKHVVEYYLDLLSLLKIPVKKYNLEVYSDKQARDWATGFLKANNIFTEDLIICIAACGGDSFGKDAGIKRWPEENFATLIDKLIDGFKAKVFLLAGGKEKAEIMRILDLVKNKSNIWEFTDICLEKAVALVEKCSLFIGNDTGPLKFADGFNKRIVALFGPIDEKIYGPYPNNADRTQILKKDLDCRPCYNKFRLTKCMYNKKCLRQISVDEVLEAARKAMGR